MSTPRFPRSRIYRDLARLEAEVNAWVDLYAGMAQAALEDRNAAELSDRQYSLEYLAQLLHEAADHAGHVYRLRLKTEPVVWRRVKKDAVVE